MDGGPGPGIGDVAVVVARAFVAAGAEQSRSGFSDQGGPMEWGRGHDAAG